ACRIPTDRVSHWTWTILGSSGWPPRPTPPPASVVAPTYTRVKLAGLPEWERATLSARGWQPSHAPTSERVAGLFICAEGHRNPVSWLPESRLDAVANG